MSSADAALQRAGTIGGDIVNALSVSARPHVDTATLERALSLANQLNAALAGVGPAVQAAHSSVSRGMYRNFTDQGGHAVRELRRLGTDHPPCSGIPTFKCPVAFVDLSIS